MVNDWWTRRGFDTREEWIKDRNDKYREKTKKICNCGNEFRGNRGFCSNKCNILGNIEEKENGCWEWKKCLDTAGYGCVKDFETLKNVRTSILSYKLFKGDPNGLCVCHSCDNRKCCNPDHLWLGTKKDNAQDALKKGRLKWPAINHSL